MFFEIYQDLWCDKCTQEITTIEGNYNEGVCPNCKTDFYLMEIMGV